MRCSHVIAPVGVAVALAAGAGCSGPPCPTDRELLERLAAHRADFEKLVESPDDPRLRQQLGIVSVQFPPEGLHFGVWSEDFIGVGGVVKGYAHLEEPPGEGLVDSIDANSDPGSPEQKLLYRPIEASWYLYYASSN